MCGILGGINTSFDDESVARLHHRGPDQRQLAHSPIDEATTLTLGQTRLNIVDRHNIALPVTLPQKRDLPEGERATIVFNGEIYNYLELRDELSALGWDFATKTDTEVALAAYLEWGPSCLARFNGMFAIGIWDGEQLFLARDRMGKKPLFYRSRGRSFEFASEVKAFSELQFVGNELFDLFEFCFNEHTVYRDVFQLPPGHYLLLHPGRGTLHIEGYWDIPHQIDKHVSNPDEAVDTFVELLTDAVRIRMRADVPVAVFLSGGLDSSLIAALAGAEQAFTCQFAEFVDTIDEETYAKDLAQRLDLPINIVRPNRDEFLADLGKLAYHLEIPTGSFSVFPLYRLGKAVHDGGFKVVLSGEGSDELFAGYARNEFLIGEHRDTTNPKMRSYGSMLRRYDGSDLDRFCRMASRSGLAGAAQMRNFLANMWSDQKSLVQNLCYVETRQFIQPLLQMGDRMTMAHSVEARCPFLDYRLVEFAFSLDDAIRHRNGQGKWIVHEAAKRVLPQGALALQRGEKHGLPTPVNLWMQGQHSFDRKYWNALMTAECIKCLQRSPS